MGTQPLKTAGAETPPSDPTPASDLTSLIRQLVLCVGKGRREEPRLLQCEGATREVLLDVEVGDVRCVLIRLPPQTQDRAEQARLSPREQEIARMVADGYPNKTIAAVLDISSWTVGTHLRRIFAKLSVSSRAAMVARLLEDRPINYEAADDFGRHGKDPAQRGAGARAGAAR